MLFLIQFNQRKCRCMHVRKMLIFKVQRSIDIHTSEQINDIY